MSRQADFIKVAAVITATPRWIGALLAAEGFNLPDGWLTWWIPLSAILSAGMALVEGLAFAFVFNAWRNQADKKASRLLWLAILSAAVFIMVLSPFIAAQVRQETLETVLGVGWPLWLWSASVAASTIVIVASVGYAQKAQPAKRMPQDKKSVRAGAKSAKIMARRQQVKALMEQNISADDMAEQLHVSPRTIKRDITALMFE